MPDTEAPLFRKLINQGTISKDAVKEMILYENQENLFSYTPSGETREILNEWLKYSNRSFYARPSYILQRLLGTLSWRDFHNMVFGVLQLIKESKRAELHH